MPVSLHRKSCHSAPDSAALARWVLAAVVSVAVVAVVAVVVGGNAVLALKAGAVAAAAAPLLRNMRAGPG